MGLDNTRQNERSNPIAQKSLEKKRKRKKSSWPPYLQSLKRKAEGFL
jgi:hypothetical protein